MSSTPELPYQAIFKVDSIKMSTGDLNTDPQHSEGRMYYAAVIVGGARQNCDQTKSCIYSLDLTSSPTAPGNLCHRAVPSDS